MTQNGESQALVAGAQQAGEMVAQSSDMDMAKTLVASGFFPTVKSASQALVKIQCGKELGFGPVASMMGVHIMEIGGKPSVQLSANMIGNLVKRGGYDFRPKGHDNTECRLAFYRGRELLGESEFCLDDAKRAGISQNNKLWEKYPKNMLFAAALRNGAKWFCSEVLLGAPMPVQSEEMPDFDPATGEIIEEPGDIEAKVVREPPEGYKPNWAAFWARAKELGLTKAQVHARYGVSEEDGRLAAYVRLRAGSTGQTQPEVVADMTAGLELEAKAASGAALTGNGGADQGRPTPLVKQPDGTYSDAAPTEATEDEWQKHLRENPNPGDEKQAAMIPDAKSKAHA